jgi:Exo-beta-D-glucosaminidase Ig-fold domain
MVTVVNQTLQPRNHLEAHAQVYNFDGKLLWEKRAAVNAAPNTYGDLFAISNIDRLTPVYFLRLLLRDDLGNVSRNVYCLSNAAAADFRDLAKLRAVPLDIRSTTESKARESITTVRLRNSTEQIAFFLHAALVRGEHGEEVLPVRWDDNYFSLAPGETREVSATYAVDDLQGAAPVVEVGGWNVLSSFEASGLGVSRTEVKPGQLFDVTAQINNTGLDGSIVQLLVDGKSRVAKRIWARGRQSRQVTFQLWLDSAGTHTLQIGGQKASVSVVG